MAAFEDAYAELFGTQPTYDPIDTTPIRPRRAINVGLSMSSPGGLGAPQTGGAFMDAYRELNASAPEPAAPEGETLWTDPLKNLGAGVAELGALAVGAGEYGARQAFGDQPLTRALATGRQALTRVAEDLTLSMSPEARDRLLRQVDTLDPARTVWQGGPGEVLSTIGYKFIRSLPAQLATLLPAVRWMKAGLTPGAITYLGAAEGGLSVGAVANGIAQEIETMAPEELQRESPRYAQLLESGMDEETARQALLREAQGLAPIAAGVTVGAISAAAGRYLAPRIVDGGNFLARFGRGALAEAPQEGAQEAAEQFIQNVAAQVYDADRAPMQGVRSAAAEGALLGGLTGGAITAAASGGRRQALPMAPPVEQSAPAAPAEPTQPEIQLPASFREIFGEGGPAPDGPATFDVVFGHVDPAVQAAMNARAEGLIPDMFEQPTGLEGPGGSDMREVWARNYAMDLPEGPPAPGTALVPTPGQQALPLQERVPGVGRVAVQPMPAQPFEEDLSAPPGFEGPAPGMFRDESQLDLFAGPQPAQAADEPSAEPLSDILAQIEDLKDPDSPRKGVYLSAASIENLRRLGAFERVRGGGVPLANFDGKGGTLIAKNRQAAEELIAMRDQGAGDMQEVLGFATGAGSGKPATGSIVVQQRDENGNVVRESLVETDEQADQLSAEWEAETGQETVILSSAAAIRRRAQRVRQEARQLEQEGETKRVGRKAEQVIESELGDSPEAEKAKKLARKSQSENEAARRLVALATHIRRSEERKRIGDIDSPDVLDFENPKQAEQYRELYNEYLGQQVIRNTAETESERLQARAQQEQLRERMAALRIVARPRTRSEKLVAAATKISEEEVRKIRRTSEEEARRRIVERDYFTKVGEYTDEQVDTMSESELVSAFVAAARFVAGRPRARKTFEQIVADHKTPSEQRKLIKRVQNFLARRRHGGKVKTAALTRSAEAKKGSALPVRKGKFDTRVLSVEKPPREMSKEGRKALAARAKQAFRSLEGALRRTGIILDKTRKGEFAKIANMREPNGERTEAARRMLIARAYLRTLAEFGNALQKANNRSAPSAIAEVERFVETINKIAGYTPKEFSRQLSKLFYAEQRESVTGAAKVDPKVLGDLVYPTKRAEMTALSVRRNAERLARLDRIEQHWQKDAYYRNHVSPLMQKFIDSISATGYMSYTPTVRELRAVQFAMRLWRAKAETREHFYKPLKRFFQELGVDIEGLKLTNDFKWSVPDITLERRYRRRFGSMAIDGDGIRVEGARENLTPQQQTEQFASGIASAREALARDTPLTPAEVEKFGKIQAVNEAINALRKTVKNGSTLDVIRAEETFIRQMGELGLWSWTNKKLGLGRVTIPGLVRDRTATVRIVTPRLRRDQMTKQEAVQVMLDLYQPIPLSREVRTDRDVKRTGKQTFKEAVRKVSVEDEIAELMRIEAMTPEQRRLLEAFNRRDSGGASLNLLDVQENPEAVQRAATAVANLLEDQSGYPTAVDVLDRAIAALPAEHRFRRVMERLRAVPGMAEVYVGYDRTGNVIDSYGRYREARNRDGTLTRVIIVNRPKLDDYRAKGGDPSIALLHIITHEAVHAATMGALEANPTLRMTAWAIMRQTTNALRGRGIDPSRYYALRDSDPREFIAEAFSNGEFQRILKTVHIEPKLSVWQAILNLVKRVLGMNDTPEYSTALDVVMALTDELFTGQPYLQSRGMQVAAAANLKLDPTVRESVGNVFDKYVQSNTTLRSLWQQAKDRATSGLLPAMTMEQLRDTYSRYFQSGDRNPLADYMRAFFKRNADNSANMETADKLSRRWTELAEQDRESALEMSRLMTDATLHQMHPELSIEDEENAHLTTDAQKRRHAELAKRWNALPEEFQDLYEDVAEYYDTTLRREVALMTLNALRGYLTKGEGALSEQEFDYTEADVEGMGLNTMEGLREEFGGLINETGLRTIYRLASIPQMRKGPYFPLMRFGDFVVYAEREKSRKHFTDRKEALAYRADQLAIDPTLDVSVRQADNGEWMAVVTEKEFRTAETRTEAERHRQEMVALYGEANTTPVQLKADLFSGEATIKSNTGLKTILGKLDGNPAAQAAIKNFYLQSLADSSFRKHELSRKNRRGVDYEQQHRTFASYAKQAAYYTSQLRFGWQMADALREMHDVARAHRDESEISAVRMGEVVREINTRDKLTHDFKEVSKLVRGGVELGHFMLLTSPSYWMINATQPYMVTLPWLAARSSLGDAVTALTNAQKLIISPLVSQAVESWGGAKALRSRAAAEKAFSVLEQVEEQIRQRAGGRADEYIKMLTALKRESIIDLSFVAELRDIASGKTSPAQKVLDASRIMAHLTEVNNRILTSLASYDIGRAKGMDHEQAVEFAKQAVSLTQFNYSSGNKPRLFQAQGPLGSLGPLVFQFMQYPQHMYALVISNMRAAMGDSPEGRKIARKTLAGIFATHLAAGGVIGMMLQPIKWGFGLAAFLFGDEDEPFDFDRSVREVTAELFGTELGEVVSAGLPRAVGIDLSQRMSLGTLYMMDLKTDNANSFMGSLMQTFGGPLVGMTANAFRGAQLARDGEWQKAFETVQPKILKDLSKTLRYTSEGLTDATGKVILPAAELSPYQLFLQSIGLQPAEISDTYARNQAVKDAQRHDENRRNSLLRRFRNAETPEERQQVAIEVAEFNKANPEAVITRSALLRSLTGAAEAEQRVQRFGADLRGREVLYADEGKFYEDDEDELEE